MGFTTSARRPNRRESKPRRRANLFRTNPSRCETLEARLLLAVIDVAGDLPAGTTTWATGDIEHIIGSVRVPLGSTLVIQPGAMVKFNSSADLKLLVDGTLQAQGTTQQPILFTSMDDDTGRDGILGTADDNDTNGNGPSNGFPGAWESITFSARTGSPSVMDHVDVRFAGENVPAAVITAGPLTMTNSTIRNTSTSGVRIDASNPVLTNTTFINNGSSFGAAVSMDLSSNPAITAVTLTNNRINGVNLDGGTLTQAAVWDDPDIVYHLTSTVTVPAGKTLTIAAGQIIKTTNDFFLGVAGTLQASGTSSKPILFTSDSDDSAGGDTFNDGATTAFPGEPGGLRFLPGSTGSILDSVNVRFAGDASSSPGGAIAIDNAQVTIHGGVISKSASAGIRIVNSDPVVSGVTFMDNLGAAVSMDLSSNPTITGPTLTNNAFNGLALDGFGSLAEDGFWDDPDIVYRLTGPVTVPAGKTLTIAPGMIIKASANVATELFVDGTLVAAGAPAAPIIFTSVGDDSAGGDSNNDGASVGHFFDWQSIHMRATSTGNVLDRVQVRFAGANVAAAVIADGGPLTMTNSTVTGSATNSFAAQNGTTVSLQSNLFINSTGSGIRAESGSTVTAINNTIDGGQRGASVSGAGTLLTLSNDLITNNSVTGVEATNRGVATISYSDVFNPGASQDNYSGLANQTGVSGNLSADPLYVNRTTLDFHLRAGSSAIDAGTSDNAPIDDLDFNFRVDDPQTPDTGAGQPPYFDIGAYERGGKPRALKHTPSGKVADVVSKVVFTLRTAMDTNSFSIANDVLSFTGPAGTIAVAGFTWLNAYQLQLTFNAQAKAGDYQLVLGPNILNSSGQALDVDGDGTRGESVDDRYTATWTIVPPRIIRQSPADLAGAPLDHIDFTLDRPMNQQSFSLAGDVVNFSGPNGNVSATGFTWTDPRTLRVSFAPQSVLGPYEMVLGPNIADAGGNLLDQSGNGVGGEDPVDGYIASFTLANILFVSGAITQNTTWNGLVVVQDAVTVQSGVTLTINPGTIVKITDLVGITVQSGATLNSNGTSAQPVRITSIHDDTIGGDSEHNGDRVGPQPGDWISLQVDDGTLNLESTQLLYGGGSVTGVWNQSGMVRSTGNSTLTVSRSILSNAFFDGVLAQGGPATITNTIITGADRGVVAWVSNSHVQVTNSTFVDNRIGLLGHGGTLNVVNSIVINSLQFGIDNDIDPDPTVSFTDIFTPDGTNTRGLPSPIGSNGNVSEDPKFRDLEHQNYRLSARSPMIDAANGPAAPATDAVGSPRVDDPNIPNTGSAASGGAFADIGAFEFAADAPSDLDLVVTTASGPAAGVEGQTISVEWTTKNIGTGVARGQWHDGIYLSADPIWTPDDLLLGEALHNGDLGPTQSYAGSADLTIPGVLPGTYYLLIRANNDDAVFEGQNVNNNVTAAAPTISLDVPTLTIGDPLTGQLSTTGDSRVYKVIATAGNDLRVALDGPAGTANELYLKQGDVPTRQSFDARGVVTNQADQSASLGSLSGDTVYVLVYATGAPTGETFTLTASLPGFSITGISPARGANSGQVTISIAGAKFDSNSRPQLTLAGQSITPTSIYFTDSTLISATFDLTGKPTGMADVQVINTGNVTTSLPQALNVVAGISGKLQATVIAPARVRFGRTFTALVDYTNTGDSDLIAPLLRLESTGNNVLSFSPDFSKSSKVLDIIAINTNGPAGILPPGAHGELTIYVKVGLTASDEELQLSITDNPVGPIDYAAVESSIRPAGIPDAQWNPLFQQIRQQIGTTWEDYRRAISNDATLLPAALGSKASLSDVFQLEVNNASAALGTRVSGHVYLRDTAHPLSNVSIQLLDPVTPQTYSTSSAGDGSFVIAAVAAGTYSVSFHGFSTATPIQLTVTGDDITDQQWILLPGGTIAGDVVLSPGGGPVGDVAVTAVAGDGTEYSTNTDDAGHYTIDSIPAGTYRVVTQRTGFSPAEIDNITIASGQILPHVNLNLLNGGTISGMITGPSGPVSGASVIAIGADGSTFASTTNASGQYSVSDVTPQSYTLRASVSGLSRVDSNSINVAAGAVISGINLTLASAGKLAGTVTDSATSQGVEGVGIVLTRGNNTFAGSTDDTGAYLIDNLPAGSYTLTTADDTHQTFTASATITIGSTTQLFFTVGSLGAVNGTVSKSGGGPLANVVVYAANSDGFVESTVTDTNGAYQLANLDADTYRIIVGDASGPGIAQSQAIINSGNPSRTVNFALTISGTVSGTVRISQGGAAIQGASVALVKNGKAILNTLTDSAGHYSFIVQTAGTYNIEAVSAGDTFPAIAGLSITGGAALSGKDFAAGAGHLSGSVQDAGTSAALAGARIVIRREDPSLALMDLPLIFSATNGTFSADHLAPGAYKIAAYVDGKAATVQSVSISGSGTANANFSLSPESNLHGTIRDSITGAGIENAQIKALSKSDLLLSGEGFSDSTGVYSVPGMPAGTYDLIISARGKTTLALRDVVLGSGGQLLDLPLEASKTTVSGQVTAAGNPARGGTIVATDTSGLALATVSVEEDGAFTIDSLPPGSYSLVASASGATASSPLAITLSSGQNLGGLTFTVNPAAVSDPTSAGGGSNTKPPLLSAVEEPKADTRVNVLNTFLNGVPQGTCTTQVAAASAAIQHAQDLFTAWQNKGVERFHADQRLSDFEQANFLVFGSEEELPDNPARISGFGLDALNQFYSFPEVQNDEVEALARTALLHLFRVLQTAKEGNFIQAYNQLQPLIDHSPPLFTGTPGGIPSRDQFFEFRQLHDPLSPGQIATPDQFGELKFAWDAIRSHAIQAISAAQARGVPPERIDQMTRALRGLFATFKLLTLNSVDTDNGASHISHLGEVQRALFNLAVLDLARKQYSMAVDAAVTATGAVVTCQQNDQNPNITNPVTPDIHTIIASIKQTIRGSFDPNDKIGPSGSGTAGFIQSGPMPYEIEFENSPQFATAAAQVVTITDTVDPDFDLSTFQFTGFGFGSHKFTIPAGLSHYETTIDLRSENIDLLVPITLDFNPTSRVVTATFQSLDPLTHQPPDAFEAGFLPIDNANHDGEGYITYTVQPKSGLTSGTTLSNQASIVFDTNSPITTPTTLHTIDAGAPSSSVTTLAATSAPTFTVKWSGTDDASGSGIASYDVYVSDNAGPFTLFKSATTGTSASFTGQVNHSYAFYTTAHDNVGHIELPPATPDTITTVTTPAASVVAKNVTKAATSYSFKVTYIGTKAAPINTTTIGNKNISVAGPHRFKQSATVVSKKPASGNSASMTVTYKITPPGGSWDKTDNGLYTIKLAAKQIKDTAGKVAAAATLGTFTVNIAGRTRRVVESPFNARLLIEPDGITGGGLAAIALAASLAVRNDSQVFFPKSGANTLFQSKDPWDD